MGDEPRSRAPGDPTRDREAPGASSSSPGPPTTPIRAASARSAGPPRPQLPAEVSPSHTALPGPGRSVLLAIPIRAGRQEGGEGWRTQALASFCPLCLLQPAGLFKKWPWAISVSARARRAIYCPETSEESFLLSRGRPQFPLFQMGMIR